MEGVAETGDALYIFASDRPRLKRNQNQKIENPPPPSAGAVGNGVALGNALGEARRSVAGKTGQLAGAQALAGGRMARYRRR